MSFSRCGGGMAGQRLGWPAVEVGVCVGAGLNVCHFEGNGPSTMVETRCVIGKFVKA